MLVQIDHTCSDERCAVRLLDEGRFEVLAAAAHNHGKQGCVIVVALAAKSSTRGDADNLDCALASTLTLYERLREERRGVV